MNKPEQSPLRQRMRELLAIPDRNRTDEQWDELIELEILLAPGNREGAPMPGQRRDGVSGGGQPGNQHGGSQHGGGQPGGRKSAKKFHKRPNRGGGPR